MLGWGSLPRKGKEGGGFSRPAPGRGGRLLGPWPGFASKRQNQFNKAFQRSLEVVRFHGTKS